MMPAGIVRGALSRLGFIGVVVPGEMPCLDVRPPLLSVKTLMNRLSPPMHSHLGRWSSECPLRWYPREKRSERPKAMGLRDRRVRLFYAVSSPASPALHTLSERFLTYHQLITYFGRLQALHHWLKPGSSNVWRVTCGCELSWSASHPHLSFSIASPIQKCLVPLPRAPAATSNPRKGAVSGRDANSLMI